MGIYAPLVLYHVAPLARERADRELNELQAVASALDRCPPPVLDFSESYKGDKSQYLHRERAGKITVFQETNLLLRPVLRNIVATIGSGSLAILVFDIDEFFRCNPYVASMIAAINDRHVIQLLSIIIRTERQGMLFDECLHFENIYGQQSSFVDRKIMDNSRFCQDKSKEYLNRNRNQFPEIRKLEEAAGKYVSISEMLSLLASIDPQFEIPKEPAHLTASSTRRSPDYIPFNRVR
jgi:hypothetical protein